MGITRDLVKEETSTRHM